MSKIFQNHKWQFVFEVGRIVEKSFADPKTGEGGGGVGLVKFPQTVFKKTPRFSALV